MAGNAPNQRRGFWEKYILNYEEAQAEIEGASDGDQEGLVRRLIIDRRETDGFKWKVCWVASSGFFTASFAIFSSNIVSPALIYNYPPRMDQPSLSLVMNLSTLLGAASGMVLFGYLADKYGRKTIYGIELVTVIVATLGTVFSGTSEALGMYWSIAFWRVVLGFGVGAEYPLSAVIAAEWSSTRFRGRMMAAVFLSQSIGQLVAYCLGLAIFAIANATIPNGYPDSLGQPAYSVDVIWRVNIGLGSALAAFSFVLRLIIPETPLYLAVQGQVEDAAEAANELYSLGESPNTSGEQVGRIPGENQADMRRRHVQPSDNNQPQPAAETEKLRGVARIKFLGINGTWKALLALCATWFIQDVGYYGLGLDNPRIINALWMSQAPTGDSITCYGIKWLYDPNLDTRTVFVAMIEDAARDLALVASGTVFGSALFLLAVNHLRRTTWMAWTFCALAVVFAIMAGSSFEVYEQRAHGFLMFMYIIAQILFNLGPNTITFMLPAEVFGTKYRATFYGITAAAGKLGAITIQLINYYKVVDINHNQCIPNQTAFSDLLFVLAALMFLGALITLFWIPDVQYPHGHVPRDPDGEEVRDTEWPPCLRRYALHNRPLEEITKSLESTGREIPWLNGWLVSWGFRSAPEASVNGEHELGVVNNDGHGAINATGNDQTNNWTPLNSSQPTGSDNAGGGAHGEPEHMSQQTGGNDQSSEGPQTSDFPDSHLYGTAMTHLANE